MSMIPILLPRTMMLIGKRGFLQKIGFPRAVTDQQSWAPPSTKLTNSFISSNDKQLTNVEG